MDAMLDLSQAWRMFPVLETERLHLRALTLADATAHFRIWGHPAVMAGHAALPFEDVSESEELIQRNAQAFVRREAIRWAVIRRDDGRLLGTCGLHNVMLPHYRAEIGYELHPDHWGQGFMSEAVWAVLGHGFLDMGLHRIEATVDPDNAASASLLRRLGFTEEGYLRERFYDNGRFTHDWFFSMLAHEYRV
jgi:ribosomal-protein-alanine N-acetyltransferase